MKQGDKERGRQGDRGAGRGGDKETGGKGGGETGGQGDKERGRGGKAISPAHRLTGSPAHRLTGPPAHRLTSSLAAFSAPILIIGVALLTFNTLRYGNPLNTGYLPQETFSAVWWQGILGQLISPGRGLLLYSPVLLLTFFGLKAFWQRHRLEFPALLAVIVIHLLLYGKWFMWHGGFAWGPRFMVATLPFWVILMAPKLKAEGKRQKAEERGKISSFILHPSSFVILWGLSIFLQLPGLAVDFDLWQNRLLETGLPLFAPLTFFNPLYSPLLGTWQFINLSNLDVAWVVDGKIIWWLLGILALNVLVVGIAFSFQLSAVSRQRSAPSLHSPFTIHHSPFTIRLSFAMASTFLTAILLITHAHHSQPADLTRALAEVNRLPNTPLIYRDPLKAIPLAELYKGRAPVLGLGEMEIERLDSFTAAAPVVWWLPTYSDDVESYLQAHYGLAREETFGQQRLLLFARANGDAQPADVLFGNEIRLQSWRLSPLQPNRPLAVELTWQVAQQPASDYRVFIHLLNAKGEIVAQSDAQPVNWMRPTSTWQPGESIVDTHALWVGDIAPGRYRLITGLYLPESGDRLLTEGGNDYVELPIQQW